VFEAPEIPEIRPSLFLKFYWDEIKYELFEFWDVWRLFCVVWRYSPAMLGVLYLRMLSWLLLSFA
jgi:hypothetical protein